MWVTVLLIYAARRENTWAWVFYGIGLTMSILLDMYLLLLAVAHVVFVLAYLRRRKVVVPFVTTTILTVGALMPFMVIAVGQAHQITLGSHRLAPNESKMWWSSNISKKSALAVLSAIVVAAAIALWRLRPRDLPRRIASYWPWRSAGSCCRPPWS
ncbi:hypothetical protein H7I76_29940 [Mycolicibacterium vaccae]|nr:hypothetical protein [Mycolicibacterium vaccae]